MRRRDFLAVLGAVPLAAQRQASAKPNIVFILTDDLGWTDLGCYGSKFYETPNIDRLASQGMLFTNGYAACPVCSPTRASIMTGKYPGRLRVTNFIPGRSPRPYARLIPPEFEQQLPLAETTIAETLKAHGYSTAEVGKWHLGGAGFGPDRQGFDLSYSTSGRHLAGTWNVQAPHKPDPEKDRADALADQAVAFIDANRDKPFFLYLSHHLPHIPLEARQELIAKYEKKLQAPRFQSARESKAPAQNHPVYAAMMENLDRCVGRVLKKLDDTGLTSRTIVVFTADNGGLTAPEFENRPTTSNAPLREGKGHVYEGGTRVPVIVRWPGTVKPGSRTDTPVSSVDWYATFTEITGAPAAKTDGRSILLALRGTALKPRPLFWHYPHYSNQGGSPGGAVRLGDYKLIQFYEDNHLELYNLREDPGERIDLASKMPAKRDELNGLLQAWLKEIDAVMPTRNPKHDPARETEGLRWVKRAGA